MLFGDFWFEIWSKNGSAIRNSIHNDTASQDPPGLKEFLTMNNSSMRNTGSEEEDEKAEKDKFKRKIEAGRGETDPSIHHPHG